MCLAWNLSEFLWIKEVFFEIYKVFDAKEITESTIYMNNTVQR